jgi:hypothetical protein
MSANLFTNIARILKATPADRKFDFTFHASALGFVAGIHSMYAYGTSTTEEVTIVNKYKMVTHGSSRFMIYDEKVRHYEVKNRFWYWKWDSIEDWVKIQKGDHVTVKYYGIRSPLLGLFPNVVKTMGITGSPYQ